MTSKVIKDGDLSIPAMKQQTMALVLGAGASHPYGFPCGPGLIEKMLESNSPSDGPGPEALHEAFRRDLRTCQLSSIDQFLSRRKEFEQVGKLAIYERIAHHENEAEIFPIKANANLWHQQLLAEVFPHNVDIDTPPFKLNVITYNYDRSLEHILSSMLMSRYNLHAEDAFRVLYSFVEITHVYGRLPPLPGESRFLKSRLKPVDPLNLEGLTSAIEVPFGELNGAEQRRLKFWWSPRFLKTIYELEESADSKKRHSQMILDASTILFMGVGYHAENMEVLGVDFSSTLPGKQVLGTAYGLSTVAYDRVVQTYRGITAARDHTCSALLNETHWAPRSG